MPDLSVLSSSLRTLNLANNKITTLTGFGALEGLQEVYLLNNELRDIGDISGIFFFFFFFFSILRPYSPSHPPKR